MMKETELAERVIQFLESQHWDVYQEVQVERYGRCADIVAVKGNIVWIIECKLSLSLAVLEQAYRWCCNANFVSVAVPYSTHAKGRAFASMIMSTFNIGYITVYNQSVTQDIPPGLFRKAKTKIIKNNLREEHKTFAKAGNSYGERFTPFRQTCIDLFHIVAANPGISLKEAITQVNHHYRKDSTAIVSLANWIRLGKVKNIRAELVNNRTKLFPVIDK